MLAGRASYSWRDFLNIYGHCPLALAFCWLAFIAVCSACHRGTQPVYSKRCLLPEGPLLLSLMLPPVPVLCLLGVDRDVVSFCSGRTGLCHLSAGNSICAVGALLMPSFCRGGAVTDCQRQKKNFSCSFTVLRRVCTLCNTFIHYCHNTPLAFCHLNLYGTSVYLNLCHILSFH